MFCAIFTKFLTLFILFVLFQQSALAIKQSYIVYLGGHSHGTDVTTADLQDVTDSHTQLLATFLGSEEKAKDAIFYSYKRHVNGFAALLEEDEAAEIANHPDVVSVFLNQRMNLHTTHSWDFLGLETNGEIHHSSLWKKARFGENTIIANVDSGVWPESKSFSDKGYGPIPSKWKGICQVHNKTHEPFCNRKLIGARYFNDGYAAYYGKQLNSSFQTPRDTDGHGSHTLSTAAGNFVPRVSFLGLVNGTIKGGSPRARAASYKVCWGSLEESECFEADVLEAIDMAIHDGVDVLSLSLGRPYKDYFSDVTAIGSFHAVKNGIVVVASAGNSGPDPGTVANVAPWMINVASSTIDRDFQANVELKNGLVLKGTSLSKPLPHDGFYPLINATDARAVNVSTDDAMYCRNGTLDPMKVKGKIVVCMNWPYKLASLVAARAGAAGIIFCNDNYSGSYNFTYPHFLPATQITYTDGLKLFDYMYSTINPEGLITTPKIVLNTKPAPYMASSSSRGPNTITPEVLKPDITAPGVNIIAAFTEATSVTGYDNDKRITPYNILSGTSMACPHVSGVVGLLKTLHPDWSPAAIKSSIMTTARTRDNTMNPLRNSTGSRANPLAYGSGHIRPNRAMDPGLVYDLSVNDYLDFLCGIGYNQTVISKFSGSHHECPDKYDLLSFNYPSISVKGINGSVTVTRRLKNVGEPGTYAARVRHPGDYWVSVEPKILNFEKTGQEKSFKLTIKATRSKQTVEEFGQLTWSDGKHHVRSPIVILPATSPKHQPY